MRYRLLLASLVLTGSLAQSAGSLAASNPGQKFFRDALVADARTSTAIRDALKAKTAIVDPVITYSDLTGDHKSDAVVRVHSTGASGVIAVYVFSTDGSTSRKLHAVFRTQRLYRAVTAVPSGDLRIDTPRYEPGDELCCPAKLTRRVYSWNDRAAEFRRVSLTTVNA